MVGLARLNGDLFALAVRVWANSPYVASHPIHYSNAAAPLPHARVLPFPARMRYFVGERGLGCLIVE
jgi:hypothetical protein